MASQRVTRSLSNRIHFSSTIHENIQPLKTWTFVLCMKHLIGYCYFLAIPSRIKGQVAKTVRGTVTILWRFVRCWVWTNGAFWFHTKEETRCLLFRSSRLHVKTYFIYKRSFFRAYQETAKEVTFQKFDTFWGCYVDLEETEKILDRDKLQAVCYASLTSSLEGGCSSSTVRNHFK